MVRAIDGHGRRITNNPPEPGGTEFPSRVTTSAWMPKKGRLAEPGLVGTAPGNGESTMGQRLRPIFSRYHIHASGLIGSPTVPRSRRDRRSNLSTNSEPHLMKARMAVGAV